MYALFGSIFAILGLLLSLFGRSRRIWVKEIESRVQVAGLAKNSAPGLELEIERLTTAMRG
jgi:cytochrome c biogenesis protein